LNYRGTPVFAEIYVLRLLQEQGWDGVWISSLGRKLFRDMPTDTNLSNGVTLPCERHAMLNNVAWSSGGCLTCSHGEVMTFFFVHANITKLTRSGTPN
jgi:hypothetical protein